MGVFGIAVCAVFGLGCAPDQNLAPARNDAAAAGNAFRADVIPIMRVWCSNASCHASKQTTLGIEFPIDDPGALYRQLQRESPQAKGSKFIVPGDPAKSYFYAKIVGEQDNFKCDVAGCGETMPPGTKMDLADRETIRRWIVAGAKDD